MVPSLPVRFLLIAPVLKGASIALVLAVLDVSFWKSLIIAVVSAVVTGVFLLAATILTIRETGKTRDLVRDVKRKVGADQRDTDNGVGRR